MKGTWYVVITVIAATLAIVMTEDTVITPIPTECPAIDPLNYTVHLAHESDCTKFYKCDHGKKIEMTCPLMNNNGERLHFNPKLQVCDFPDKAGCTSSTKDPSKPTPSVPTPSKPSSSEPTPSKPSSTEPTPSKPSSTEPTPSKPSSTEPTPSKPSSTEPTPSKPSSTEPTPSKPSSTEPTPSKPSSSEATPSEPTSTKPSSSKPNPSQPSCSPDGVGQSHECSCEKYYLCKNSELVLQKCPDGLHWNSKAGKCDKAIESNCIKEKTLKWYY
ncbi:probable chitinase 10 isoform X1 [Vespa mandarinia]|uniref:probable chitinase 10 isoform X1 n=1 Tax=Vespa mandarinia TaxID=7446 RepID=UPI0016111CC2|nr:probable chitinase 10 isoform X1 [Vespa mandarinia]